MGGGGQGGNTGGGRRPENQCALLLLLLLLLLLQSAGAFPLKRTGLSTCSVSKAAPTGLAPACCASRNFDESPHLQLLKEMLTQVGSGRWGGGGGGACSGG